MAVQAVMPLVTTVRESISVAILYAMDRVTQDGIWTQAPVSNVHHP